MNYQMNPVKTAFAVGVFVGGLHLVWSILIAFGWAQALVDFKLRMHMISIPVVVNAFDFSTAGTLVLVAAIVGGVFGYIFARIWNRMHAE